MEGGTKLSKSQSEIPIVVEVGMVFSGIVFPVSWSLSEFSDPINLIQPYRIAGAVVIGQRSRQLQSISHHEIRQLPGKRFGVVVTFGLSFIAVLGAGVSLD